MSVRESRRVLLDIEYDGTDYCGWQRQINGRTVQEEIETALEKALGVRVPVTGASRTDAGVHALCQRAHMDVQTSIPTDKFPFVLNTRLPRDVRVTGARDVPPCFHARFDAQGKIYTYRIHNAPTAPAITRRTRAHVPIMLDLDLMQTSARTLLGTHDFSAFQAAGGTAKTTVRTIEQVSVTRDGALITLHIKGNAFLYNMVRIIAGTLIYVGQGKLPPDAFSRALQSGDRLMLGATAPPQGLELTRVLYQNIL